MQRKRMLMVEVLMLCVATLALVVALAVLLAHEARGDALVPSITFDPGPAGATVTFSRQSPATEIHSLAYPAGATFSALGEAPTSQGCYELVGSTSLGWIGAGAGSGDYFAAARPVAVWPPRWTVTAATDITLELDCPATYPGPSGEIRGTAPGQLIVHVTGTPPAVLAVVKGGPPSSAPSVVLPKRAASSAKPAVIASPAAAGTPAPSAVAPSDTAPVAIASTSPSPTSPPSSPSPSPTGRPMSAERVPGGGWVVVAVLAAVVLAVVLRLRSLGVIFPGE